jgi:hypothetical protein
MVDLKYLRTLMRNVEGRLYTAVVTEGDERNAEELRACLRDVRRSIHRLENMVPEVGAQTKKKSA